MRVLVTGGAGYIGSHCVKLLCERGHEVVVLDNLCAGHRQAVHPDAQFLEGDTGDRALLDKLFSEESFDGAMHFAAFLSVPESVAEPLKYYHNNVGKTIILLEAMRQAGLRKLVFSSTCATYGAVEQPPITEDLPKDPVQPYGRSKLMVERILQDSAPAWQLGSVSLRYFNASGCAADGSIGEDHDPEIHLIPRCLLAALGKVGELQIFGTDYPTPDGTCIRDYVHVDDLAEAHLLALEAVQPGQARAYNVGVGKGYSVREVIDAVRKAIGRDLPVREAPRRPGDPPALFADPSKIQRELGWKPKYDSVEAVVETAWRWFAAHPDGYAD